MIPICTALVRDSLKAESSSGIPAPREMDVGASPAKGLKDIEGIETSLIWRKAERVGAVQSEEKKI